MMRRLSENTRRRGVTLVELVAVMVAGAVFMGVTISALVAVQQADRRFNSLASERRALGLLADQLRVDVHAALRVTWDADANRLTLTMPAGDRVTYERQARRWERRVGDQADQSLELAGAFRAPSGFDCVISPAAADAGTVVRIAWISSAKLHDPRRTAAPQDELIAAVGRDLALLNP